MEIVKLVDETYKSVDLNKHDSLETVIHYILHRKDVDMPWRFIGGIGVNPADAAYQFRAVKKFFRKDDETRRQLRHFVVSFEGGVNVDPYTAYMLAGEIAKYYSDKYQIFYAVHEDTDNVHIHFGMNTVSYVEGSMYAEGYGDYYRLIAYIENIVKSHL